MSVFLVDENPNVASAGLGGVVVGGARSVPDRAARSEFERAAPARPAKLRTETVSVFVGF